LQSVADARAYVNQSVHNRVHDRMDEQLNLEKSKFGRADRRPSGGASYVTPQEQLDRVRGKFDVATKVYRETGDSRARGPSSYVTPQEQLDRVGGKFRSAERR
jgi:hypothetical protein